MPATVSRRDLFKWVAGVTIAAAIGLPAADATETYDYEPLNLTRGFLAYNPTDKHAFFDLTDGKVLVTRMVVPSLSGVSYFFDAGLMTKAIMTWHSDVSDLQVRLY